MNAQRESQLLQAQAAIADLIKFGEIMLERFESGPEGATEWGALKFTIEDAKKLDLSALEKLKAEVRARTLNEILCCRHANNTSWNEGACPVCEAEVRKDALEQIRESDCMITTPKVLMEAHKKNIKIADDALAKVKEGK